MNNILLLDPYIIEREGPVPPVVWDVAHGLTYEDIKEDRYEETVDFMRQNYFNYDTLCRSVRLAHDVESADEMCKIIRFLLADECSVAAFDVATGQMVGVVIMKIMWKEDYSWPFYRLMAPIRDNSGASKVMNFSCEFIKYSKKLQQRLDTERTVHLFMVVVARQLKGKLLKERLLLNAYKVARSVGATSLTWICCSDNDEERAKRVRFVKVDQKNYGTYTDAENGAIFKNIDPGEHKASLYGCVVGPRASTSLGEYMFPEYNLPSDIPDYILSFHDIRTYNL